MDGDQGWREQLEVFIGSELAHRVIRPGEERMFTLDFEDWLTSIDVNLRLGEPGYGNDPTYLEDRVASFVDHEVAEGRMVPQDMTEREDIPALFDTLSQIARTYDAEAVQERALAFEREGPDSDLGRAPLMDDNRTWQEQLDAFMQSELGSSVIRPGMETAFTGDFDDWLRSLNLDRWEGDVGFGEYLEDRLERFLEHQLDAGHLDPPHLGEVGFEPILWDALYDIAMAGLEGRYRDEVARGVREDMRDNAIVHITFRDGQVLDLDAEAQRDSFLGEGDEDIVSEERFTGVRWERVGQGDAETVQFTGVNASGQRQVIGGPDEGRHVAQDREGVPVLADAPRSMTERVQDLLQVIADFVHGRETRERSDELGR